MNRLELNQALIGQGLRLLGIGQCLCGPVFGLLSLHLGMELIGAHKVIEHVGRVANSCQQIGVPM
jgi:hypothetical protein